VALRRPASGRGRNRILRCLTRDIWSEAFHRASNPVWFSQINRPGVSLCC
jgi:hypothetical protein